MTILRTIGLPALLLLAIAGMSCHEIDTEVIQGTCMTFDPAGKMITVKDEREGTEVVFDLSLARIGLTPEKGNIVRIAYRMEEGRRLAVKVMNVTKQDLQKD